MWCLIADVLEHCVCSIFISTHLWRWNRHSVPKRRLLNTTHWGTTQKITCKIFGQLCTMLDAFLREDTKGQSHTLYPVYHLHTIQAYQEDGCSCSVLWTRLHKVPSLNLGWTPTILGEAYCGCHHSFQTNAAIVSVLVHTHILPYLLYFIHWSFCQSIFNLT
jgi:hypothetical protein